MPLWIRRIIYLSFIALFLLVAPILALYSMGYRYHWGKHRIERTGLLVVDGEPRDAIVRIDGAVRARGLPARIGGLGENEYTVRIERDGHIPREERVAVVSGRTTFANDIRLFRDAPPTLEFAGTIASAQTSADGQWLAFTRTADVYEELWLMSLREGPPQLTLRFPHNSRFQIPNSRFRLAWSPRNATLLVTTPSDTIVIDPNHPQQPRSLIPLLPPRVSTIAWELASTNALIARSEGRLSRLSLATERSVTFRAPAPEGPFAVARGTIYATLGASMVAIPIDGAPHTVIATVPDGSSITAFTDLRGTLLEAETKNPDRLLTIATTTGTVRMRTGCCRRLPEGRNVELWHANAFELWVESGDPPLDRLIARRENPIIDAVWHPHTPYIIIATAHDVTAMDHRASAYPTTLLAPFDTIQSIAIHPDGDDLTVIGRRGTEEGLWMLPLR
ncbi:hypothetical protein HY634_00540 [Candidatus Uhrbacteria bacterium]|nr:hypothetical protein [Candidatus Uhrbacteria bacterium]